VPLLIVAPLEAAPADLRRIEALRRRHDPAHGLIPAHVTLVFPVEEIGAPAAASHVAAVAARQAAVALRLSAVLAMRDEMADRSRVFLVPDRGRAEIEQLHDALYDGLFAAVLRTDIPYIPHVTVAVLDHHDEAEVLAREIGQVGIAARISRLQLADFDGRALTILDETLLQS